MQRSNRNGIYIFVNRRLVRDRLLLHAISEAYRNIVPPGVFPVVLLFLDMPYEEVDVNVHPAKIEVRFRHPQFIHDFTRDTLRQALVARRVRFPVFPPRALRQPQRSPRRMAAPRLFQPERRRSILHSSRGVLPGRCQEVRQVLRAR